MTLFDLLKNRFQLRFKNRMFAAHILTGALEDSLKKMKVDKNKDRLVVFGIPRGGAEVDDAMASKIKSSSCRHLLNDRSH
jgi:predicted phosphoribosyltransferase